MHNGVQRVSRFGGSAAMLGTGLGCRCVWGLWLAQHLRGKHPGKLPCSSRQSARHGLHAWEADGCELAGKSCLAVVHVAGVTCSSMQCRWKTWSGSTG